jgi:3-oxoacyl-[acyl-carrier protein] reductase
MADKKYGVIINIASKAGYRGYFGGSAYCSSKAGLMRLTESIAADIQGSGICICAICPSTVATPDVLVEKLELNKSLLLKPKYIGRVVLKIISSPEKYKNRCIMLSQPKILLKTFVLMFRDTFFDLIDNYRFRR